MSEHYHHEGEEIGLHVRMLSQPLDIFIVLSIHLLPLHVLLHKTCLHCNIY